MNSNQGKYESNNNQHIPNEQMYQRYDESCNCPQNMYGDSQQDQEVDYFPSYRFMENHMYEKNQSYNEFNSYMENMVGDGEANLPKESKQFQGIVFRISANSGIYAYLNPGYYDKYNPRGWCRSTQYSHQASNAFHQNDDQSYFIFYLLDNTKFCIANRKNGEVLQLADDTVSIISRLYTGNSTQEFKKSNLDTRYFRLITSNNRGVDVCDNKLYDWTKITSTDKIGDLQNMEIYDERPIMLPGLPNPTPLEVPKNLMNPDDTGVNAEDAPRAIKGSVLIPAIVVSDIIPLEQSIKNSPYYVLKYKQYWHKSWTVLLDPGQTIPVTEDTGMYENTQTNMKETIDMSIGADWKLRFFSKSNGFQQQIYQGLNTLPSQASQDLSFNRLTYSKTNINSKQVRYVKYNLAYEFELTRMDGTPVSAPWVAFHPDTVIKTFPHDMSLLVDNLKLVRAGNSYDLSIYKTPLILKDGQIYRKNAHNSKLYYR
ncbi:hypothetical protein ACQCVL_08365 [Bacillus thuringiensis]|uniref:hypothetical protein n=1 Tax=Bacillus thuringiensis TaxID=1428 RepID=UPI003CEC5E5E